MAKTYRLGAARRAANSVMALVIRLGAGPKSSHLLTTTGRRSGETRTTPVTLVDRDGNRWLVAPYGDVGWVHNVHADNTVSLKRGGHTSKYRAIGVPPEIAGPVLQQYVREVPITASFFDASADDPASDFVAEATRHPVFRLTTPIS